MRRRTFVRATTGLGITLLAGCLGDDGDGDDDGGGDGGSDDGSDGSNEDESGEYSGSGTERYAGTWTGQSASGTWEFTVDWRTGEITGSTSGDVNADVSGSAEGGTIDAEGDAAMGTVTWTGTFSADGSSVSGEWSGLGDSGTWEGSPAAGDGDAGSGTDEDGGDTDGDGDGGTDGDGDADDDSDGDEDGGDGDTDGMSYGDLFSYESNYAIDFDFENASGESTIATARYYDGDSYIQVEPDYTDDVFEMYRVGGEEYLVLNGAQCFRNPDPGMEPDADLQSEANAEELGNIPDPSLEPSRTDEIDGETVSVYEVGAGTGDALTLYVSTSTGYLRRVEAQWGTASFHSWGAVDPITAPDMNCQSVPG